MPLMRSQVVLIAMWALSACTRSGAPAENERTPAGDVVLQNVKVRSFRGSEVDVVAQAPSVDLTSATSAIHAPNVKIESPKDSLVITAAQLDGVVNEGQMHGTGGVNLQNGSGVTAAAPSAHYDRNLGTQGTASGSEGVQVNREGSTLNAQTFTFDIAEQHAVFDEPKTHLSGAP